MSYSVIQVGTGGRGEHWCSKELPPNIEDGLIDVIAAVDSDPDVHENAQEHLSLDEGRCYTDIDTALSEKPIADTLEASVRIAEKVDRSGVKMGVTMSHRFDRDKTTFRRRLRSGECGPIDYLVGRFTCNARSYGAWGAFRHEMEDALMIEGAVHQLDYIADMAGDLCQTIYADTWLPEWAEYEGDVQALVQMRFQNGVRATWEGAKGNAVTMNGWGNDYLRAECKNETLVLDGREISRYPYDATGKTVSTPNRRNTTPFTAWIRAVTQGQQSTAQTAALSFQS
ncbi:MAG: Gfo/Idh/MocA family protein [Halobacteriales archaeon]